MKFMILCSLLFGCTTVITEDELRKCEDHCVTKSDVAMKNIGKNIFTRTLCCECSDGEIVKW